MVKKKNAYAAKHQQEDDRLSSWAQQNADLWQIFKEPYNFESIFLSLSYDRQLEFLRTMQAIQTGHFDVVSSKNRSTLAYAMNEFFEKIQWMTETSYEEGKGFYPLANDEKRLVRMECYGSIDARKPHQLSTCYRFFMDKANKSKKHYKLKDYDLKNSPIWRVFNQFESFRGITPKIKKYFYDNNINPDVLSVMSVNDFCDVIYHTFATHSDQAKARFLQKPLKNQFVIDFMKKCGKDFYAYLLSKKIDERLVFSLCHAMKRYGICDTNSITALETHFTERVLSDLKKHDYHLGNYKVGDKIPLSLIDNLVDQDQGLLLAARDENGYLLDKSILPKFEVHHADGVQFAHSSIGGKMHYERYLAQVNYPNSLMLVESNLHHLYFHGYDSVIRTGHETECYYSRINSDNPYMVMIDGFDTEHQMFCDMEDSNTFLHREQEDRKNVVNYFVMSLERLDNIQKISKKYGITYSSAQLTQEINEIQKAVGLNNDLSGQVLKGLDAWVRSVRQGRKAEKKAQKNLNVQDNTPLTGAEVLQRVKSQKVNE